MSASGSARAPAPVPAAHTIARAEMATRNRAADRGRRISLILAITSGLAVVLAFLTLAAYRGTIDFGEVADTGTQSIGVNPTQGQAEATFTATYSVGSCGNFAEFYWGPNEVFLGRASYD